MSYTSLKFFLFIAVVMLLYFGFPRKQYRWTILLGASYYFYLLISYRLVGYILFTTGYPLYPQWISTFPLVNKWCKAKTNVL